MTLPLNHAGRFLLAVAWSLVLAPTAPAQELVVVTCGGSGRCSYERVYAVTLQGDESARMVAMSAASDAERIKKSPKVRLAMLPGVYRDLQAPRLRVRHNDGTLGDAVLPTTSPGGAKDATAAFQGLVFECRTQPKGRARTTIPMGQFVALLSGNAESVVAEFVGQEMLARTPHPRLSELVAGALVFEGQSAAIERLRSQLRDSMRHGLAAFQKGDADPTQLESVLEDGLRAARAYRMIAGEGQAADPTEAQLVEEHDRFLQRVKIAGVLKNANLHDAFLEEMDQLGLARFARPDLVAAVEPALRESVQAHDRKAEEFERTKQWAPAIQEARLASRRAPCDDKISSRYSDIRVGYVHDRAVEIQPEYDGPNKYKLRQIVDSLQAMEPGDPSPEARQETLRRIADGEAMDPGYLPLLLEKAKFLVKTRELTAARDVVIRVERDATLSRTEAEEWLKLDEIIRGKLVERRQQADTQAWKLIAGEQFDAALKTAADGLVSDPRSPRLLYVAAVAAAVLRNQDAARQYANDYLRTPALGCADGAEVQGNLLEIYRADSPTWRQAGAIDETPNWVSGRPYAPGQVYYDPLSGSFQPHVRVSRLDAQTRTSSTEFVWDGPMVLSITTAEGPGRTEQNSLLRPLTTVEPVYDPKHVYMKGISLDLSNGGTKKTSSLKYLNSPDVDPFLAAKFTGRMTTRGWAGNPFFHPFQWDGVYLFDLAYDELGRIRTATPVAEDMFRLSPQFSEPLTFVWEGSTKRLKSISGARYRREMVYDERGRLEKEIVTHALGRGSITYQYDGLSMLPSRAICRDEFYDYGERRITLATQKR